MQKRVLLVSVVTLVFLLSFSVFTLGCPVPQAASVSPNTGLNTDSVNVVVKGAKFHKSAYVKLTKSGQPDIIASNLKVTENEISCTLDLKGKAEGPWDLVVGNIGSITKKEKPSVLAGAFTVNKPVVVQPTPAPTPAPIPAPEVKPEEKPVVKPEPVDPNKDLKAIYFDFDKSNIRDDELYKLDLNVKVLESNSALKIVLCGHADERGTAEYNMKLSSQRAASIQKYLVEKGIDASRIITYAYGEDSPIATGKDESSWSHNRRVDIALWENVPTKEQALEKAVKL